MNRQQSTHFIEQYNVISEYRDPLKKSERFWPMLTIGSIDKSLRSTASAVALHTVAIFKIRFKNADEPKPNN